MFIFIVKHFGFLKSVPLLALLFDSLLRIWTVVFNPALSGYLDDLEAEIQTWPGANITLHKYGGTQFNLGATEIGHVHSNGLLDILFTRQIKQQLLAEGQATDHHTFVKSGWVSFYIRNAYDMEYALGLLKMGYERHIETNSHPNALLVNN